MTARKLTRAALALLFIAALAGCSHVVDPATGQLPGQNMQAAPENDESAREQPAVAPAPAVPTAPAETAELDRLRRENQTLKVQQGETQARMDALTKQLAQEREEQRRFREMMTTNFDLLEQSVAKSLADNMERNARKPEPKAEGTVQNKANKTGDKTPLPGPAMAPPPANADVHPAEAAAPAQQEGGPMALQPMPYWDEKGDQSSAGSTAGKFDPKAPQSQKAAALPQPPHQAAAPSPAGQKAMDGAPAKSQASAPPLAATAPGPGGKSAPQAAAPVTPVPVVMAAPVKEDAAFNDPDLLPPAEPRTLTAHPEAKPVYEKGFVRFAKGDYAEAIRIYEDLVARFPDDLHTDNAQFWLGEAYLQQKDMAKADAAYRAVLRHFAHKSTLEGYKTPDAIYRLGQMALMKNDPRRAEYYFRNVSERFLDSTAGRKAQRELDTIRVNTAGAGAAVSPDS